MLKARPIARELALLTLGQFSAKTLKQGDTSLEDLMTAAVRVLTSEAQDILETAGGELQQCSDRLLSSQIDAVNLLSAHTMVTEAMTLVQSAINRVAMSLDMPEISQMANQEEVRAYAMELCRCVKNKREELDMLLNQSMVDWQITRLPKIDQDILRIAIAEFKYMGIPHQVAINEAVELAKRYSDEEGRRFINGVLRRVVETMGLRTNVYHAAVTSAS
jgi:transcription antitermination protein NusB